jgi:hypothetical protein
MGRVEDASRAPRLPSGGGIAASTGGVDDRAPHGIGGTEVTSTYRGTQNILAAANAVVPGDAGRAAKRLWSDAGDGPPIVGYVADSEHDEAAFVAEEVDRLTDKGKATPGQVAVLYRTNAQSRVFEEVFVQAGLPYKVVGGVRFYERREVRDLLAYLRLIANPGDEVSLRRILNVPRRGIGDRAEACVAAIAEWDKRSFAATLACPAEVPGLTAKSVRSIEAFNELIDGLRADNAPGMPVAELAEAVLDRSGYLAQLQASEDLRAASRIENLNELISVAREFDAAGGAAARRDSEAGGGAAPEGSLADFLAQVSVVADVGQASEGKNHGGVITLMTLPSAKRLKFPVVFLTGLEENVLPHQRSVGDKELEEERQLAYVGVTSAAQRLYLTRALARTWCGRQGHHAQSRFLAEVPESLIEWRRDQNATPAAPPVSQWLERQPDVLSPDGSARPGVLPPGDTYLHRALDALIMRRPGRRRFLAGVVCATTGLGLFGEGVAMAVAPRHPGVGEMLFFVATVVPFAIFLTVLMVPRLGSLRQITIAILGLYPALVYRMSSPIVLAGYDEHLHAQSLMNLLLGSGLFSPNPSLRVSPYYPGLELFTGVVIRLTGLPVVLAMSLVVLLCRLILVLLIYHSALLVSPSRRGASLVVAFYAVSPEFYSFNSGFAYQTLALTLGLGGVFLLRRAQLADYAAARRLSFIAYLVLIACVVTHHATSWMVLAFLIAWAAMSRKGERELIARAALVMGVAVAIGTAALTPLLAGYFLPIFSGVIQAATAFLGGTSGHHIFGAYGGTPPPADWERVALVVYILSCSFAALACAWIMLRQAFRNRDCMLGLLGALNLAFLLTSASHFYPSVGELGNRASTFFFLPLALSCSLIIQRHPRVTRRPARTRNPFRTAVLIPLIGGTTIIYLGGVLLGSNPDWNRLPGPYLVSADFRTQDPETLAAVDWAATHLPTGSTVAADRVPAVLLESQARLWPVTSPQQGLEPAQLYFSANWGPQQTAIVKGLHIDYLYVDRRLADSLPYLGYYISQGETPHPTRITAADVAKFAHVPGLKAVYHHGPVTIYNTAGLGVAPERKGFRGYHSMGLGFFDAILGAGAVLLILLFRKRLAWMKSTARNIGVLGTTLAIIAISILVDGALFGLRLMPGPAFTLGAVATSVVVLALRRRTDGLPLVPRLPSRDRLVPLARDPLVLLGFVTSAAGLAIAIYAAWITDVAVVHTILRAIT